MSDVAQALSRLGKSRDESLDARISQFAECLLPVQVARFPGLVDEGVGRATETREHDKFLIGQRTNPVLAGAR